MQYYDHVGVTNYVAKSVTYYICNILRVLDPKAGRTTRSLADDGHWSGHWSLTGGN